MRTEERVKITKMPLFLIKLNGFIHRFYKPAGLYEDHLITLADDVIQNYAKEHNEAVKPLHRKIAQLEGLIPDVEDNRPHTNSEVSQRAVKAQLEIKLLQEDISRMERRLHDHIESVNKGLSVLLSAYKYGYYGRKNYNVKDKEA